MHISTTGQLVIDDHYVCEFMKKNGTEEMMVTCETVLKTVCVALSQKTTSGVDDFMHCLEPWGKRMLESISSRKIDTSDVTRVLLDMKSELGSGNVLAKLEDLKERMDLTKAIDAGLKRNDETVLHNMGSMHKSIDTLSLRVESLVSVRNTTRYKGEEGEAGIMSILECKLPIREGYEIFETKSKPHNCDILVKKTGFPDVRLEIKAHGRDTGECVRSNEVKRFETDLISLNDHGIFVSLYSGIVGKSQIEIDILPTNKFAVYISNNNYDGDALKEFINLIYKLNVFIAGEEGVKISTEAMTRIKAHLIDFNAKIASLKTNMKSSLDMLNSITFDIIEKLLCAGMDVKPVTSTDPKYTCETCHKDFSRPSSLTNHKKTCKHQPAPE
jgi:hypothetical protein